MFLFFPWSYFKINILNLKIIILFTKKNKNSREKLPLHSNLYITTYIKYNIIYNI